MNIKRDDVVNKLINNTKTLKNFGVQRLGLFGSFIRGAARKNSDIDILVKFEDENENFRNLVNLYFFLENLLGKKIDLITTESISPYLKPYILKEVKYIEKLS